MIARSYHLALSSSRAGSLVLWFVLIGAMCRLNGAAASAGFDDDGTEDGMDHPKWMGARTRQMEGRYIIEFDDAFDGSPTEFMTKVEREHTQFRWTVAHDLDASTSSSSSVFRGISIQLQRQDSTISAAAVPGQRANLMSETQVMRSVMDNHAIKRVYPVVEVPRPTLHRHNTIRAHQLDVLSPDVSDLPFSHTMTQVDRVRQELGLTGKGITVGIIDTGVDFYHPALGGGFGPGYKVALGYDLVGSKFNFTDTSSIMPKEEPLDTCDDPPNGHGTHVAGIIGAQDTKHNFTGVAPEATLGMWRIFGCSGSTSNDLVIKAMIMAYEAGCNIINLSLGGANSWPEDPTAVVADRIAKNNVTVVVAAGNEGSKGGFMISSPSTGYDVISVASIDNIYSLHPLFLAESGESFPYSLSSTSESFPNGTITAYSNTSDKEDDGCPGTKPHDENALKGKLVLVKRGTCMFDKKAEVLRQYGAVGMVVYDKAGDDAFAPTTKEDSIPTAAISHKAGLELLKAIENHDGALAIEFNTALSKVAASTAGMVSEFSSIGPTSELGLKPDIAGVGGHVFSTLPGTQGGYGTLSGTSMAAPYVAGVCALYQEAHGTDVSPLHIRAQLQNYAKVAKTPNGSYDSPVRQGAGLIQAYDSIQGGVRLVPGKFSFNDTAHREPQQLTLTNLQNKTATFTLRNQPAVAIEPYNIRLQGYSPLQSAEFNPDITASLAFDSALNGSITLQPGESITIPFSVDPIEPSLLDSNRPYPVFGGTVQVLDDHRNVVVQAPYMGVVGNVTELPIFGPGFPFLTKAPRLIQAVNATDEGDEEDEDEEQQKVFHLDQSSADNASLLIVSRLVTGTARLVAEIINADSEVIGTAYQDNYVQRNTLDQGNAFSVDVWSGTFIPTGIEDERKAVPVTKGDYRLRWRALKLLADPASPDSWETVLSPKIIIT